MPIAEPEPTQVERFRRDLDALLAGAGRGGQEVRLGVALSGGPDSVALAILAASACPGRVMALTVDHGLRAESAAEAEAAAAVAARIGIPHAVCRVTVAPVASLQAAAREARYAALGRWAEAEGLASVLTAHHADDQAETLLMRLARGAGVAGLAGIRAVRPLAPDTRHAGDGRGPVPPAALDADLRRHSEEEGPPASLYPQCSREARSPEPHRDHPAVLASRPNGGTDSGERGALLLRPLLGWPKAELEAIVAAAGLEPVRDPSNADPRYDRTAARALLGQMPWLDPQRLAASARHLADADRALDWAAERCAVDSVRHEGEAVIVEAHHPREIVRRLLVGTFAGFGKAPDGPALDRLLGLAAGTPPVTVADMLVACRAGPRGRVFRLRLAPPRRAPKRSA